jgi:D-aminopeptidase
MGGYVVGAIVQTNFGGVLQVEGVPVGREMGKYSFWDELMKQADGSCMMVIATDAPLDGRNLRRLAKRGFMGMARTGGIASNGSGDYVIAFSTAESVRVMHGGRLRRVEMVGDDYVSPVFMAGIEAVEEAIIGSLFAAVTTSGKEGRCVEALPVERVISILKRDGRIQS